MGNGDFGAGFFCGVAIGILLCLIMMSSGDCTYKDGQIDALTGKIKYKLVTKNDSTKTWETK